MNRKSTKKRILALTFLVCFLIVSIITNAFTITHADHDHDRNGIEGSCATCAQLFGVEKILKQFNAALAVALFAATGMFVAIAAVKIIASRVSFSTLFSLKIRLNN